VALAGAAANLGQGSLGAAVWWLMPPVVPGREELAGLMEVTAVVPRAFNRLYALEVLLLFGLPTVGALMWALWREARALPRGGGDAGAVARWALLGLAWSWLAWYALLSVGVPRYLLPVALVGALFLGALLRDLTGGLDPRATLAAMAAPLRRGGPAPATAGGRWSWAGAWLAALIVAAALPLTALSYARYYVERDHAAERVAAFLNTRTPPEAVVETYESELHFLLERPYHYPPDPVHVALNRRGLLGEAGAGVDYDPLAADPDYLVVGIFARGNDLYAPALDSGAFRSVLRDGDYEVFERVR
jgi:hypothetical protein